MNPARALAVLILAVPAAAAAQVSYSQARIAGDPVYPVYRADYRACLDGNDTLLDRRAFLEQERRDIERDGAAIEREGERLRVELSRLPSNDAVAVADYNRRSSEQNHRVAAHNRRVAEMNAAASMLNGDTADLMAYCNLRTYAWRTDVVPLGPLGEGR